MPHPGGSSFATTQVLQAPPSRAVVTHQKARTLPKRDKNTSDNKHERYKERRLLLGLQGKCDAAEDHC